MGVTLPTFPFLGNVCVSMQYNLLAYRGNQQRAGAVILSTLALTLSPPIALCAGTKRRRSTTVSLDICGKLNDPDT